MKKIGITLWMLFVMIGAGFAQATPEKTFNLDFETLDKTKKKPLKWYLRNGGSYSSQLTNTEVKSGKYAVQIASIGPRNRSSFGVCTYAIPSLYKGANIELKGYMKTKEVGADGHAGLWLRVDRESGDPAFDNMINQQVTGTNDWKEYSIKLNFPDNAKRIVLGGLLTTTGQMWIDDLRLFIDGKPIEDVPHQKAQVYPAQADKAFAKGSKINFSQINKTQAKHLSILGKVWGFVKYHHPEVAKGNHNMDKELFRVLPKVMASKSDAQRDQVLLQWIEKLGKIPPCKNCASNDFGKNAKLTPDHAWMKSPQLSKPLKAKLQYIFTNRYNGSKAHYYIKPRRQVQNPVFKNEASYADFKYPDTGYRLLALYRYWNIIQYYFPYKYAIGKDWNKVLDEFIPQFVANKNALEYHLSIKKLVANINDSHGFLRESHGVLKKHFGVYTVPVIIRFIENQVVVTDYYDGKEGKESGLKIGDIILEIDGVPVKQRIKELLPLTAASNKPGKMRNITRMLLNSNKKVATLKVKQGGKVKTLKTPRLTPKRGQAAKYYTYSSPKKGYRLINKEIGYIHIGKLQQDDLAPAFELFKNTKGLVIDIRNYPSAFTVFSLSKYLHPQPREFVKFARMSANTPGVFVVDPAYEAGEFNSDYYKGKVIIIVNEVTQSSAEYHSMAFRKAPKATVIGSITAGADGNISRFPLPGGFRATITGLGVYYPDGTETQREGIVPDIKITPTIAGIKAGKDELLEKAIELIKK
jgi:C-terminal processing protease CtpA/Prc